MWVSISAVGSSPLTRVAIVTDPCTETRGAYTYAHAHRCDDDDDAMIDGGDDDDGIEALGGPVPVTTTTTTAATRCATCVRLQSDLDWAYARLLFAGMEAPLLVVRGTGVSEETIARGVHTVLTHLYPVDERLTSGAQPPLCAACGRLPADARAAFIAARTAATPTRTLRDPVAAYVTDALARATFAELVAEQRCIAIQADAERRAHDSDAALVAAQARAAVAERRAAAAERDLATLRVASGDAETLRAECARLEPLLARLRGEIRDGVMSGFRDALRAAVRAEERAALADEALRVRAEAQRAGEAAADEARAAARAQVAELTRHRENDSFRLDTLTRLARFRAAAALADMRRDLLALLTPHAERLVN